MPRSFAACTTVSIAGIVRHPLASCMFLLDLAIRTTGRACDPSLSAGPGVAGRPSTRGIVKVDVPCFRDRIASGPGSRSRRELAVPFGFGLIDNLAVDDLAGLDSRHGI